MTFRWGAFVPKEHRYLICGEPISTFIEGMDTGVLLAQELCRRHIPVCYCTLNEMDPRQSSTDYLAGLSTREILSVDPGQSPAFELGPLKKSNVRDFDVILQRKDPPVDDTYIAHAKHFAEAPQSILQMNSPKASWRYSEHLLPQWFPEFSAPTHLCENLITFIDTVNRESGDSVAKPNHLFSGKGIEFFSSKTAKAELEKYWNTWGPNVVVQPYLKDIESVGDLRILTIGPRIVGSVLRKPKAGSRLANLHQGGSAHAFSPTPKQLNATRAITRRLNPLGLILLGIDFIGDLVTEINITCPSAVPQINQVMGIHGEAVIVDELEKLLG